MPWSVSPIALIPCFTKPCKNLDGLWFSEIRNIPSSKEGFEKSIIRSALTLISSNVEKTGKLYGENVAYKLKREKGKYITYTHKKVDQSLGVL